MTAAGMPRGIVPAAGRTVLAVLRATPTVVTLAALGGVGWWGAQSGWRLPSAAADAPPAEAEPAVRVTPGPSQDGPVRGVITFAAADDVRRAGLGLAAARTRPLTRFVSAAASVGYDPAAYAQLSARAAGTVWWAEKVPGQPVAAGEVVALIDAAEVGRAKADLLTAIRQQELAAATLDRLQASTGTGTVTKWSVADAQAAADDARFRTAAAQQALLNLGLDARPQDLRTLSADDRISRLQDLGLAPDLAAAVRRSTQSANLLPVVAPFAGAVVKRSVTRGEAVLAGRPLFVVAAVDRVHLELALDPADLREVRVGQEVRFTPDADPAFEATGSLAHLVPEVDEVTRKVWAHAEAANPGGRLRPNAYGRGRVVVAEAPAAVVVPADAVQPDGDGWVAFVRTGEAAFEARRVRPGLRAGGLVQVDGVAAGEEVVTAGSHALLGELKRDQLGGAED